mgnify:CR=1 FL=1
MKKKIGLIVDNTQASKQINDLVKLSLSAQNYEITTLIINNIDHASENIIKKSIKIIRERGFADFIARIFLKLICYLEKISIIKKKEFQHYYDEFDLLDYQFDLINVKPQISKSGLIYRYSESDLRKIKCANLNLIVRAGSGIIRGDILKICPNGIISFHHSDNDVIRGGPAAFWEVYLKHPRTGFIIQRLNDELDGGDVLFKGFIRTSWFYSLNLANLYEISNPFFHRILEKLTSNDTFQEMQTKTPSSASLYRKPNVRQILFYLSRMIITLIIKKYRVLLGKKNRWGVAYQYTESWNDVRLSSSKRIQNPKNRFLADPFLIKRNNKHYCFVEDFDYSKQQGCISVYEITKSGHKELGIALDEDFHLAYPFIFEYDDELYMCPETSEKNDIRLYRCVEFPLKWELHKILMKGVSAADTGIFFSQDRWWLISNIDESIVGEHFSQLHIFHNKNPLDKDWIPHRNNPVIFDPLKARNGGLIIDESEIYRVHQRQGFDRYGEAMGVSKIKILDTDEYIEEYFYAIEPNFFPNIRGTHTYNYVDGLLVFDYAQISKKKKVGGTQRN